jgi:hypothetical protein
MLNYKLERKSTTELTGSSLYWTAKACLWQLLAVQYGTICAYYSHHNVYVFMTAFDNERIRVPVLRNSVQSVTN